MRGGLAIGYFGPFIAILSLGSSSSSTSAASWGWRGDGTGHLRQADPPTAWSATKIGSAPEIKRKKRLETGYGAVDPTSEISEVL